MPNIYSQHPHIVQRHSGGFLAYSSRGDSLRIGVTGETADEAAERWRAAVVEWRDIIANEKGDGPI